jgi:protein O-GlcNAc transferase
VEAVQELAMPEMGDAQPQPAGAALQAKLDQGWALHRQGKLADAECCYEEVLQRQPDHFAALHLLGVIARQTRRTERAVELSKRAIELNPKLAAAHSNLGNALMDLRRPAEALASYDKAIALKRDFAVAQNNRGAALRNLKRLAEALASYDRAITLKPDYAEAHNNRGNALMDLKRPAEALASYERAIALMPNFAEAHNNRGSALIELKGFMEALASCDRAIALKPDYAEAHYNRGNVFFEYNLNHEASAAYQKAFEIKEEFFQARAADCFAELPILYECEQEIIMRRIAYEEKLRALCDVVEARGARGDLTKILDAKRPFYLAYQGYNNRDLQRLYGSMACRIMEYKCPKTPLVPLAKPNEKVKVGIVSAFFYRHSNWKIPIKGWLGKLDRNRFKIFGYHVGTVWDSETNSAAAMCDRFVHRAMTIDDWRREILYDAPHILIYPGLSMDKISTQLAAQRLAPVQCNSWGHPDTSGMQTLDYYLSSELMEPDDATEHYTERLIRLPNLSIYYEPIDIKPSAISRTELGLRSDAVVFWCGQSLYKYLPQYDSVFARIAQLVKNCQFVFVKHHRAEHITDLFRRRLERAFAVLGLKEADYCVLLPKLSPSKFIGAIGQCEIVLDSIGWSGCNSNLESLFHNLPIVTMQGSLMRGRHSAAILRRMEITETITKNVDEFVTVATRLANHADERNALSRKIASNKHRLYRDRTCIEALEEFLDRTGRQQAI